MIVPTARDNFFVLTTPITSSNQSFPEGMIRGVPRGGRLLAASENPAFIFK